MPASVLAAKLQSGDLSPLEVVQACIDRVEQLNSEVNAIATLNPDVLAQAASLENLPKRSRGILYGLPIGIKDTTPVAGLRTTFGSPLFRHFVPAKDALIVERLRSAGALILGKTNSPEFAVGGTTNNLVFGVTTNPWNTALTPGGSTGGGAAALAAGMVALADGTDLGGSLRLPASFCGVVGLRPSVGLVPAPPTTYLWDTLSVAGGMGRTAADVALFLQATYGPDPESPVSQPHVSRDFVGAVHKGNPEGLRLAWCRDIAGIGIEGEIAQLCQSASFDLGKVGARVETVEMNLSWVRPAFDTLRAYQLAATHEGRINLTSELGKNLASNLESAKKVSMAEMARAEVLRTRLWKRFKHFFRSYDFLLTPCAPIAPFSAEQSYPDHIAGQPMATYYDWFAPTYVLSLTGLPVSSVPCGLDHRDLPVGLQIVGRPNAEEGVLALAQTIQDMNPIGFPSSN